MADVSKIAANGITYDVKDETARSFINNFGGGANYVRFPNGVLIQWGTAAMAGSVTSVQIPIPYSYANTNYAFSFTTDTTAHHSKIWRSAKYVGGLSISCERTDSGTIGIDWIAVGIGA